MTCGWQWQAIIQGRPRPKGSWNAYRGRFVPSAALTEWTNDAILQLRLTPNAPLEPMTCPVTVEMVAHFPWPKRTPILRRGTTPYRTSQPDIDKLARAVLDVLVKAGVIADDRQVVRLDASKRWTDIAPSTHLTVTADRDAWPECDLHSRNEGL